MKRRILSLVAATLLLSTAGFSQLSLGIKAGINISNFSGGDFDAVEKKALLGFHGGGFLNVGFGGSLSLQPELLLSTQGARIDSLNGKSSDWKVSYITVPVMLKYRTQGSGFYLEAGPQFGFKVSDNIKDQTIENFANDLDLAFGAGLGFQSKGGLGIGARYLAGISKVGDFDSGNINPDFRNSVIQVGLFLTLMGGK